MRSKSVICFGKAVFEEDTEEKIKALNCIMKHYTKRDFSYSAPAVNNVKIWRVKPDKITCRYFGVPYKEALRIGKIRKRLNRIVFRMVKELIIGNLRLNWC